MSEEWTEADDVIEEIRAARRQLFAQFDNDLDKIGAYYMALNKKYADRLVGPPAAPDTDEPAIEDGH